jgi:acetyltransferase-like isoleucine patch superfamily enzyme
VIAKNIRHRLRLYRLLWQLARRHDVLIERDVTVKYIDSIRIGVHCTLQSGVYLYGSRRGLPVVFGDFVAIGPGCALLGEGGFEIGRYTHFGPHVVLTTQYGDASAERMQPEAALKYAPVAIGEGCWIGAGAVILPGVSLGAACIVEPNSVVFGAWPAGSRLRGNPARRVG